MRCVLTYCIWCIVALRCLQADLAKPTADVAPAKLSAGAVELTSADFETHVQDGRERPCFVLFYAPWCGHCQRMASGWEQLATNLHGSVNIAKVDATREKSLAAAWGVEGFPTLKLIASQRVYTYNGPRTVDMLELYARKGWRNDFADALPGSETDVVLLTNATFRERITSDEDASWFVLFYVAHCEHCKSMAGDFQNFAVQPSLAARKIRVAKVNAEKDEELSGQWVTIGFPTMKLFRNGKVYNYDGERTAAAMEAWVLDIVPPPPTFFQRLLTTRIYGVDPLLPLAFILGILMALMLWCSVAWISRVAAARKEQVDAPKQEGKKMD